MVSNSEVKKFQKLVYKFYQSHRRSFSWRSTKDPYKILVSEVMLQQTQTQRVEPFFVRFIKRFPSVKSLARAPIHDLVHVWKGLGYNRRALYLKRAAEYIIKYYRGVVPVSTDDLEKLPGIGRYSARAIGAFAFNQPTVFLETNIRTVFLFHYFKNKHNVSDKEILFLVEKMLDKRNPRKWYFALMDYGAHLKRVVGNVNMKSKHYVKQPVFRGSRREIRGKLLALALEKKLTPLRLKLFSKQYKVKLSTVSQVTSDLVSDGFLRKQKTGFSLL